MQSIEIASMFQTKTYMQTSGLSVTMETVSMRMHEWSYTSHTHRGDGLGHSLHNNPLGALVNLWPH